MDLATFVWAIDNCLCSLESFRRYIAPGVLGHLDIQVLLISHFFIRGLHMYYNIYDIFLEWAWFYDVIVD